MGSGASVANTPPNAPNANAGQLKQESSNVLTSQQRKIQPVIATSQRSSPPKSSPQTQAKVVQPTAGPSSQKDLPTPSPRKKVSLAAASAVKSSRADALKGVKINTSNPSSHDQKLWDAAREGDLNGVEKALRNGANIDYVNKIFSDYTPLMISAFKDKYEVLQLLVDLGANMELKDRSGQTALFEAAVRSEECTRRLIEAGSNVCAKTPENQTVLHRVCDWSGGEMVEQARLILTCPKFQPRDVNKKDCEEKTALECAEENGHSIIADMILDRLSNKKIMARPVQSVPDSQHGELTSMFSAEHVQLKQELHRYKHRLKMETDRRQQEEREKKHKEKKLEDVEKENKRLLEEKAEHEEMVAKVELLESELRRKETNANTDAHYEKERERVTELFKQSIPNAHITLMQKVHNHVLLEDYNKQKERMNSPPYGGANERELFHGTSTKAIQGIMHQGLDVRLAGTAVGTLFGKGVYLGTTAKISDAYAHDGVMLVVRALVGQYTIGKEEYRRPPPLKPRDVNDMRLFDSCVDNMAKPRLFVIFDNQRIYPEYVIHYTT